MNAFRGSPALLAFDARRSRSGPVVPLVPAAASVWQPPQPPEPVKIDFPFAASPDVPPDVEPPVEPEGVEVDGAEGAVEGDAVESGSGPRPTLEAPLVSVPDATITMIITAIPAIVPRSPATSTLIMAAGTIPGDARDTASRGYGRARRTPSPESSMLDK